MANDLKTDQELAREYLKNRLGTTMGLFENLPKIPTFADLKEGEFFIRFPWAEIKNSELVFKNTELFRKILTVRQMCGPGGYYNAISVVNGSLHEISDWEPVIGLR